MTIMLRQRLIDTTRKRFPHLAAEQIGFFVGTARIDYRPQIRLADPPGPFAAGLHPAVDGAVIHAAGEASEQGGEETLAQPMPPRNTRGLFHPASPAGNHTPVFPLRRQRGFHIPPM